MVAALNALPPERRRVVAQGLIEIADKLGPIPPTLFFEDVPRRRRPR
jgi:hypothetical protein